MAATSTYAFLPTLGTTEAIVIFILILLLFGAKKIPELARGLGKSMGEFKRAREDFENEVQRAADDLEDKSDKDEKNS